MKHVLILLLSAWIVGMGLAEFADAQPPPLLKVRFKIEGVETKRAARAIHWALLSVPGVKKAEVTIPKRWFFFRDYENVSAFVEFERGRVNSETLVHAVEWASKPKSVYTVKFLE